MEPYEVGQNEQPTRRGSSCATKKCHPYTLHRTKGVNDVQQKKKRIGFGVVLPNIRVHNLDPAFEEVDALPTFLSLPRPEIRCLTFRGSGSLEGRRSEVRAALQEGSVLYSSVHPSPRR